MSLNKALLRKVEQHILAEPQRLRMDSWVMVQKIHHSTDNPNQLGIPNPMYNEPQIINYPVCGLVGCIAGWITIVGENFPEPEELNEIDYEYTGRELLGDHFTPFDLFYVDTWPAELTAKYKREGITQEERAQVVCEAIEKYITMSDSEESLNSYTPDYDEDDEEY